ncbi:toprim domain-containing protein [Petroclostridium sp. X23]|uniref:DNA gyrase/topoisomerase IV subunit B n=1 Tax=Petroclostridium sp. X23 TaxID=3045146 RepID=UPI0024AE60EC|nr:toprim domain-containing protein [Petroclostridium sp. X23]WHH57231.1 toprim domain-containing protein [Petroclostridium sp. X23]
MPKNIKGNEYGNESISSLKGADRVRLRPGVIFGSDGIEGCQHSVFEILSNSIDEAREGYGSIIEVVRYKDRSIQVIDRGRGIPLDYNAKEERYNWELVFCELYAGGKYKNNTGENYEFSLGLNGLGSCATQYSSEYMDVMVYRDGFKYELHFEKGENIGGLKKEACKYERTGTIIKWRPDIEVFTDIDIPLEYFQNILKKQAVVNAGLLFSLYDEETDTTYEYKYDNGIIDYIKEVSADKSFTDIQCYEAEKKGKDREDKQEYKVKMQTGFCFNNEINLLEYYHNSSFLEYGGSPDKAVKNAFIYVIDQYLKSNGKYNKNEGKVTFTDIQDSLILVSNSFSTVTSYENQTKKAITNKFIQEAMTDFLKQQLEIYFIENKVEADKIAEQILINKRSRETAEKARINIKKKLGGSLDMTNRVQKFVDCRTKDLERRELYIVEGDSALGACKLARDGEFQAIIPVRGKILNCLKADYDKIFKNDIIIDLLKVLGCGVEIKSKHNKDLHSFEYDNLRWNKIIICTDADVDGFQIRTLILTMLYRLVPTLIDKGKVYIAESPLYEISTKNKTYFAYTDREKDAVISKLKDKYTIQRSKGLGENEPEMMWQTTMCPDTRKLIQVLPENIEKTQDVFELLLGDNLQGRKDFIAEHGYKYIDLADVS